MKKKILHLVAVISVAASLHGAGTIPIKFLNKTDAQFSVLSNNNPSEPSDFMGQAVRVAPGAEKSLAAAAKDPKIVFWETGKAQAAFVYGFNPVGKKSIDVRIVLNKGAYKLEPQTTLGVKRFDEKDIKPLQGLCVSTQDYTCPTSGTPVKATAAEKPNLVYVALNLKPSATDADILGLSAADAKNADKVKGAWRKKSFAWHPDKLAQEPARSRFEKPDLVGLTDQEKRDVMTEVIKRINVARDNLMKTAK